MCCKENAIIRKKQTKFYFSLEFGVLFGKFKFYFIDK
jgi:hypothetical protein